MTTFDTNVVVRLIIEDDPDQSRSAEQAWRTALADGGVFLPKVVIIETCWVLRRAYRFDAATIATTLRRLLDVEGVDAEDEAEIRRALDRYADGSADFSDYVVLESARSAGRLPVQTFDQRFAREDDVVVVDQ